MSSQHPSDDLLELYLLQHLSDPQVATLEEHLMLCSHCQHRTERTQEFLDVVAAACTSIRKASSAKVIKILPSGKIGKSVRTPVRPALRWVGGIAAAALLVAINIGWLSTFGTPRNPEQAAAMPQGAKS